MFRPDLPPRFGRRAVSSNPNLIYLQDLPVTFPQADGGSVARELGVDEALPYRKDTQIGR